MRNMKNNSRNNSRTNSRTNNRTNTRNTRGKTKGKRDSRNNFGFRRITRFDLGKEVSGIDYKNAPILLKFLTDRGKIISRKISGISAKHQRLLSESIKRARFMAMLPSGGVGK